MPMDVSRRRLTETGSSSLRIGHNSGRALRRRGGDPLVQVESVRGIRLAAGRIPIAPHFKVRPTRTPPSWGVHSDDLHQSHVSFRSSNSNLPNVLGRPSGSAAGGDCPPGFTAAVSSGGRSPVRTRWCGGAKDVDVAAPTVIAAPAPLGVATLEAARTRRSRTAAARPALRRP